MDTKLVVFLVGCIGFRTALAARARFATDIELTIFSIIGSIVALSFAVLYIFDLRKEAPEAGGVTWWVNYRPIHSVMYGLAAYLAFTGDREMTSNVLFMDVAVGLTARLLQNF